jgi:glycosyltransferase involved in cell wall biosynthesis
MISVVIPTYKSPDALDLCLKSATEGQRNKNQIVVVVDGFYDLNKAVLEKYRSLVEVLVLEENQGLCRATNLGVYNTSGERILIVNDDNVFDKDWDIKLEMLDAALGDNFVWAPNQIEPSESMFAQFHIKDLGRDPKTFDLEAFWKYTSEINGPKMHWDNQGSTLPIYIKKIDYMRLGGWDENYEKGMVADWDFFLKCQLSGMKMYRTYHCHFYHFVSLSVNDNESQTINHVTRREAEWRAHNYAQYKWGTNIKHNPVTNLKYL